MCCFDGILWWPWCMYGFLIGLVFFILFFYLFSSAGGLFGFLWRNTFSGFLAGFLFFLPLFGWFLRIDFCFAISLILLLFFLPFDGAGGVYISGPPLYLLFFCIQFV